MGFFQKALNNIKTGTSAKAMKGFGVAALGAISYAAVPTIIEAVSMKTDANGDKIIRIDMTGWKGVLTGAGVTIIGGLATGQYEFAVGGASAAAVHIGFARLNDWVFYPILGKHLFRFDPKALDSMGDDTSQLPAGAREVNVGGKTITVLDRASVDATPVSGYGEGLLPQATPNMSGYGEGLLPQATPNLSESFATGLSPQAQTSMAGYGQGLLPPQLSGMQTSRFAKGYN